MIRARTPIQLEDEDNELNPESAITGEVVMGGVTVNKKFYRNRGNPADCR
jgi:hypothetical protein